MRRRDGSREQRVIPPAVLLVAHALPPHVGGIEVVANEEARALSRLDLDVTVLTSSWDQPGDIPAGWKQVTVPALNLLEKRFGVPFPLFGPSLIWRSLRAVRHADVVHVHDVFYLSSLMAGIAAWALRKPVVLTQHVDRVPHPSLLIGRVQDLVFQSYGRWLMRSAGRVIVLNTRVAEFVAALGVPTDRIEFLPNGVDLADFRPADGSEKERSRSEHGLPPDRVLVLFVGRLVPKKGFQLLVDNADPSFDLVFVGGEERRVEQTVNGGKLIFLGKMSRATISSVYRASDIFCLPSTGEGFPATVQEAIASGLPVITTNDEAYANYELTPDAICLVTPERKEIGVAVHHLAGDAALRAHLGRNARVYAETTFSWQHHADRLQQIYAELTRREPVRTSWVDRLRHLTRRRHRWATERR